MLAARAAQLGDEVIYFHTPVELTRVFRVTFPQAFPSPPKPKDEHRPLGAKPGPLPIEPIPNPTGTKILRLPAAAPAMGRPLGPLASPAPQLRSWLVGFSKQFIDDITGMDRKRMGRLLEAISELTEDPMKPHGDTVKALTGDLKGWWRYRLADYRLVYFPDPISKQITLNKFTPRGDTYD